MLAAQQPASAGGIATVLHAARLLEVDTGNVLRPGEILVVGERIKAVGATVDHPQGAKVIDLGDMTLMPGLIDAHVHLFLASGRGGFADGGGIGSVADDSGGAGGEG